MESNWKNYHENTSGEYPPRPFLVKAIPYVSEKKEALDLGGGALNDCKYLLREGFEHVTVVDIEESVKERVDEISDNRVDVEITPFDSFDFQEIKYNLINAQYSLPFHGSEGFDELIKKITKSLKTGGIFVGQFFGTKDEWNTVESKLAFQDKEEVQKMLSDMEIIKFQEEEKDGTTASGNTKHWHIFHFIARKK